MQFQPYTYIPSKVRERKLKISYFFLSSRGITVKNHWTMTKFELDLRIPMTYSYIKFELNVCKCCQDNEWKLKISNFFSKFKRDNSVKNHRTMTKFEHDLRIPMTCPYVKFELNVCNCCWDNERKLKISDFFLSSRGITLSKIIGPRPIRTWPTYSYDVSICQIWVECVQLLSR